MFTFSEKKTKTEIRINSQNLQWHKGSVDSAPSVQVRTRWTLGSLSNPNHAIIPCYYFCALSLPNFSSLKVPPSHPPLQDLRISPPQEGSWGLLETPQPPLWAPPQPDLPSPSCSRCFGVWAKGNFVRLFLPFREECQNSQEMGNI